ncbi:MAG TPA: DUF3427 domain-containing protein, partial [Chloroflexota bacterium]|nr:DUF3427 domain-containing protein [Chloroflexota bacterium]
MTDLPRGLYDQLVTAGLDRQLMQMDADLVQRDRLDAGDAHEVLARHLGVLARRALLSVRGDDREALSRTVDLANRIAEAVVGLVPDVLDRNELVAASRDVLHGVADNRQLPGLVRFPPRPEVPLSSSALLVNGRDQPRIGSEIQRELASADRVDLLCAFVKWHGFRIIEEEIGALIRRGGRLRVIATT